MFVRRIVANDKKSQHIFNSKHGRLFFSFYLPEIDSSIDHLQNALNRVSFWMTAAANSQLL